MKPTTAPAVLWLTLLLTGCGSAVRIESASCDTLDEVTLSYGEGQLALDRGCVEASPGTPITLHLQPASAREASRVTTKFVGLGNRWLDQVSETGQGEITLQIPMDEDRKPFKYVIKVKGVGKLDPRIVVQ